MQGFQYQMKDTPIHRLNPIVKLIWAIAIVVLTLLFDHPAYILAIFVALSIVIALAQVSEEWTPLLRFSIWLGLTIIIINALVSFRGDHVLLTAPFTLPVMGRPTITLEAIAFGAIMALKLTVIISAFVFINLTIHPDDLMSVLLKARLPYKSVLVASLATRYIPCLIEDARRISDAYRTRGVSLDDGNWFQRVKSRARIMIPLLTNSLDRAVQVAEAMESRGFGTGQRRVFYRSITVTRADFACLAVVIAPLVLGVILKILHHGNYVFYPSLGNVGLTSWGYGLLVVMSGSLLAIVPLALLKRSLDLD